MASDKELEVIARIVLAQKAQLEGAAQMFGAVSRLLGKLLKKCAGIACDRLAIFQHTYTEISMCERCAAETIVKAGRKRCASDADDSLNPVRESLMNEEHWTPLEEHESITKIQEYIDAIALVDAQRGIRTVEGMN